MSEQEDILVQIEERLSASRLGKSMMRETDKDLVALRKAGEALRGVLDLHCDAGPSQGYFSDDLGYGWADHCCATCGSLGEYGVEWPCPTAIAALGVETGASDE